MLGPQIARPGLDRQVRHRDAQRSALVVDDLPQRRGQLGRRGRGVGTGVGDAEAAAEVQLGQRGAGALGEVGMQPEGAPGGDLEALGVEDLRADVGVDADQFQPRLVGTGGERRRRAAAGDGEAELLIFVCGGDVLMRVRLHPGRGAHHDPGRGYPRSAARAPSRSISAKESTMKRPTPASSAWASSSGLLLLPCSPTRSMSMPARCSTASSPPVQTSMTQPLLAHPPRDRGAEERLARVVDVPSGERLREGPGTGPQVGLVQHVRRGTDASRQAR